MIALDLARPATAFATTLSGFSPASPAAGQAVSFTVQITNSGQTAGSYTLTGQTQVNGVHEGYLSTATGSVPAGGSVAATVQTAGGIAAQYNATTNPKGIAATALDVLLTLNGTQYLLPGAILLPAAPAPTAPNLSIVSVSVGVVG